MLTVSAYTKKTSKYNTKVNYDTLTKRGYPMKNLGGGGGDHPALKELRITVQLAHEDPTWVALTWACGMHKTQLVCVHATATVCPDTVKNIFSHKQLGYAFHYVSGCGKQNHFHVVRVLVSAAANKWMGRTGWWSNILKMMQVDMNACMIVNLFICV